MLERIGFGLNVVWLNNCYRSVLQLCSPNEWANFGSHQRYDNVHRVSTTTGRIVTKERHHRMGVPSSKSQPIQQIPADTMYTNMANLHQTIMLQQQLFRQALNQRQQNGTVIHETVSSSSSSTFPGEVGGTHVIHNHRMEKDATMKMEWKVKRRQNGTRYIARRPIRNRILRNRTKEIIEERATDLTTEDETCSEVKVSTIF